MAMTFLCSAALEGQTVQAVDPHILRATRLMRLFNEQVETMARLKGKGGQQRVVAEHVTVTAGGQAIVGLVTPGGGRGRVATIGDEPHGQRRGWLRNGNPPGDVTTGPRCGAKTRRQTACQSPAMRNGRCQRHGGKSTGPKTAAGLERSRRANWKHGAYSREVREMIATNRRRWRELMALLEQGMT